MDNKIKVFGESSGLAFASLVLGSVGMLDFLPILYKGNGSNLQLLILGLFFGFLGLKSLKRNYAIAGMILSFVGLILFASGF